MSAEVISGDVTNIQDEDLLRRMWTQTDDFGKKKEIRAHMYKLREARLKDLCTSSDTLVDSHRSVSTSEIHRDSFAGSKTSPFSSLAAGIGVLGGSQYDSFGDQSFQSMKSKEIRDSESPTRDYAGNYKRPEAELDISGDGWTVTSKSEASPDGKSLHQSTRSTAKGTRALDDGTATFSALKEDSATVREDGDERNHTKSSERALKSAAEEHFSSEDGTTIGSKKSSTTSTSKMVTQKFSSNSEDDQKEIEYRNVDDNLSDRMHKEKFVESKNVESRSKNVESRTIDQKSFDERQSHQQTNERNELIKSGKIDEFVDSVVSTAVDSSARYRSTGHDVEKIGELVSRKVQHPDANTTVITETRELPDGSIATSTRYEHKDSKSWSSSASEKCSTQSDSKNVSVKKVDQKVVDKNVVDINVVNNSVVDKTVDRVVDTTTDRVDTAGELVSRKIKHPDANTTVITETRELPDGSTVTSTRYEHKDSKSWKSSASEQFASKTDSKVVADKEVLDSKVVDIKAVDKNVVDKTVVHNVVDTSVKSGELISRKVQHPDANTTVITETRELPDGSTVTNTRYEHKDSNSWSTAATEKIVSHNVDKNFLNRNLVDKNIIDINVIDRNVIDTNVLDRKVIDIDVLNKNVLTESSMYDDHFDSRHEKTSKSVKKDLSADTRDETELFIEVEREQKQHEIEKKKPDQVNRGQPEKLTRSSPTKDYDSPPKDPDQYKTTYQSEFTSKRVSVDTSPTHNAFASSLRADPLPSRGSTRSSTSSLRGATSPEKRTSPTRNLPSPTRNLPSPTRSVPTSPRTDGYKSVVTQRRDITSDTNTTQKSRETSPTKDRVLKSPVKEIPSVRPSSPSKQSTSPGKTTSIRQQSTDKLTSRTSSGILKTTFPKSPSTSPTRRSVPLTGEPETRSSSSTSSVSDIEFVRPNDGRHDIASADLTHMDLSVTTQKVDDDQTDVRTDTFTRSKTIKTRPTTLEIDNETSKSPVPKDSDYIPVRQIISPTKPSNSLPRKSSLKKTSPCEKPPTLFPVSPLDDRKDQPEPLSTEKNQVVSNKDADNPKLLKEDNDKGSVVKERPPFVRTETYEDRCRKILGMPDKSTLAKEAERNITNILGDLGPVKAPAPRKEHEPIREPDPLKRTADLEVTDGKVDTTDFITQERDTEEVNRRNALFKAKELVDDRKVKDSKKPVTGISEFPAQRKSPERSPERAKIPEARRQSKEPESPTKNKISEFPSQRRSPKSSPDRKQQKPEPKRSSPERGYKNTIEEFPSQRKSPRQSPDRKVPTKDEPSRGTSGRISPLRGTERSTHKTDSTRKIPKKPSERHSPERQTKSQISEFPSQRKSPQRSPERTKLSESPVRSPTHSSPTTNKTQITEFPSQRRSPIHKPDPRTPKKTDTKVHSPERTGKPQISEFPAQTRSTSSSPVRKLPKTPDTTDEPKRKSPERPKKPQISEFPSQKKHSPTPKVPKPYPKNEITDRKPRKSDQPQTTSDRKHITTAKINLSPVRNIIRAEPKRAPQKTQLQSPTTKKSTTTNIRVKTTLKTTVQGVKPSAPRTESEFSSDDEETLIENNETTTVNTSCKVQTSNKTNRVAELKITRSSSDHVLKTPKASPARVQSRPEITVHIKPSTKVIKSSPVTKTQTKSETKTSTQNRKQSKSSDEGSRSNTKHITTKSITLTPRQPIRLSDMNKSGPVVDVQKAKSSREASPDRLCPVPVNDNAPRDVTSARFPDKITEPDDGEFIRYDRSQSYRNVIHEDGTDSESDGVFHISELDDTEGRQPKRKTQPLNERIGEADRVSQDDEALLSVTDKVSRFLTTADSVVQNTKITSTVAPKVPRPKFTVEDSLQTDECLLSVGDKVSKFLNTAEETLKPKPSSKILSGDREEHTLEDDECLLSVTDKVSKFLTTAEEITRPLKESEKTNTCTKVEKKKDEIEKELKTDESIIDVSGKLTYSPEKILSKRPSIEPIIKKSPLTEQIKKPVLDENFEQICPPAQKYEPKQQAPKYAVPTITPKDKIEKSLPLKGRYSPIQLRSTEAVKKAKLLFENISQHQQSPSDHQPIVAKQGDVVKPAEKTKDSGRDVRLTDIGVYKRPSADFTPDLIPKGRQSVDYNSHGSDEDDNAKRLPDVHPNSRLGQKPCEPTRTPVKPSEPTRTAPKTSEMSSLTSKLSEREMVNNRKNSEQRLYQTRKESDEIRTARKTSVETKTEDINVKNVIKFGVTLRRTDSGRTVTATERRRSSAHDAHLQPCIEDIFDLELLEQMLETVVGYEQRRRIRAQIRLVKRSHQTPPSSKSAQPSTTPSGTRKSTKPQAANKTEYRDAYTGTGVTSPKRHSKNTNESQISQEESRHQTNSTEYQSEYTNKSSSVSETKEYGKKYDRNRSTSPDKSVSPAPKFNTYGRSSPIRGASPDAKTSSSRGSTSPTRARSPQQPRRCSRKHDHGDHAHDNNVKSKSPEHHGVNGHRTHSPDYKSTVEANVKRRSSPSPTLSSSPEPRSGGVKVTSWTEKVTNKTELRKPLPQAKEEVDDKPSWVKTNVLKKTSDQVRTFSTKKTTEKSSKQTYRRTPSPSKNDSTSIITSSYGVGPMDENGKPLFGIRALRHKVDESTKVRGTIVTEQYHSQNGGPPVGQVTMTRYSTDPTDLEPYIIPVPKEGPDEEPAFNKSPGSIRRSLVDKNQRRGLTSVTTVLKVGQTDSEDVQSRAILDSSVKASSAKIVRRGSVKELTDKFIKSAVETSKAEKSSGYKAGLILRSSSFKDSPATRSNRESVDSSSHQDTRRSSTEFRTSTTSNSRVASHSQTSTSKSFLGNESRVTDVQDILTRMRNADQVVEPGDSAADSEARALLNKFLGAAALLSGMEAGPTPQHRVDTTSSAAKRVSSASTTTKTDHHQESRSQKTITTSALEEIWDERTLRSLLEQCSSYDERRKIRTRLRQVMADQEACADVISSAVSEAAATEVSEKVEEQEDQKQDMTTKSTTVASSETSATTKTVSSVSATSAATRPLPKAVSPFAKFRQMDRQNSPVAASPPGSPRVAGPVMFRYTDPALARSASTVKDRLLQWAQMKTKEYENVKIDNFSTSWADGMAFCALVHHFLPDAFNFQELTPQKRRHNFTLAFRVADEKAGIAPLLDVDDMVAMRKPDWKCVFTYVQAIYRRFKDED